MKDDELKKYVDLILNEFPDPEKFKNSLPDFLNNTAELDIKFSEIEENVLKSMEKKHELENLIITKEIDIDTQINNLKKREVKLLDEKNRDEFIRMVS